MIDGLTLTPLKIIQGEAGDVYHALKSSESSFQGFGEAYFSTVKKDQIKGWKKHTKMILNLIVPAGKIRFVIFDDRKNSETSGKFFETIISKENYQRMTVPPGVWMAFQGIGDDLNLLLNVASIPHDPTEAVSNNLEQIKYEW